MDLSIEIRYSLMDPCFLGIGIKTMCNYFSTSFHYFDTKSYLSKTKAS